VNQKLNGWPLLVKKSATTILCEMLTNFQNCFTVEFCSDVPIVDISGSMLPSHLHSRLKYLTPFCSHTVWYWHYGAVPADVTYHLKYDRLFGHLYIQRRLVQCFNAVGWAAGKASSL